MLDTPFIKADRPSPEQIEAWKQMSFGQKLSLSDELRSAALRLREAMLRREQPQLSEDDIRQRLRDLVLHGGA